MVSSCLIIAAVEATQFRMTKLLSLVLTQTSGLVFWQRGLQKMRGVEWVSTARTTCNAFLPWRCRLPVKNYATGQPRCSCARLPTTSAIGLGLGQCAPAHPLS